MSSIKEVAIKFGDAFNEHDLKGLGDCLAEDSVFYTLAGDSSFGNAISGKENILNAFAGVFAAMSDARWEAKDVFACEEDNKALTNWIFTGTSADGTRIEAEGCDILTFEDGKIIVKNAFRKQVPVK